MAWGVVEEKNDGDGPVAFHVIPILDFDGEDVVSAAHEVSNTCQCRPSYSINVDGNIIWTHSDPDHDEEVERKVQ